MMFVHLIATVAGAVILIRGSYDWLWRLAIAVALQLLTPILTVTYRAARGRRRFDFGRGAFLYWLYYWARLEALAILVLGGSGEYRK
jgi:hypothetical protein